MNEPLGIVQVEDAASDAVLIVCLLEQQASYHLRSARVEGADEMHAARARQARNAIIADHHMAQFDALWTFRILRKSCPGIPFIIISGAIGEDFAVKSQNQSTRLSPQKQFCPSGTAR